MRRRTLVPFFAVLLALTACSTTTDNEFDGEPVTITDNGTHYAVVLDYASGLTPREMGTAYGEALAEARPDYESLLDGYITYLTSPIEYQEGLRRVGELKAGIPEDYREEIEGLGETLSAEADYYGDGALSVNEAYMLNLITDILRTCQCSGVGVYGSASDDGNPIAARLLDWNGGGILSQLHAVTTIRDGSRSVCLIGYLGHLGAITAVNDDSVFAGILDSPTGWTYEVEGRRSYVMDLRFAMEEYEDLDDVSSYLADDTHDYCYNHNILLSDPETVAVLENNFSGWGDDMHRALRRDDSELNPGVEWGHDAAVAVVNSFVLLGNHDNHTGQYYNTYRWQAFSDNLDTYAPLDWDELKTIATDYAVYSASSCQHVTVFSPVDGAFEINFKPRGGGEGVFEVVEPAFD